MITAPSVVVFDVNETLSDMSSMAERFTEVGAPGHLARVWFAAVLRDGFALAASGSTATFAGIARGIMRDLFRDVPLTRPLDESVAHVMTGFTRLSLHPDVADGVRMLGERGFRLTTLSNGSVEVAEGLLSHAGIRSQFERLLTVEGASAWKPARSAYEHAASTCRVEPSQMLLVAVHPWDIHGAAQAGLATAWINRGGASYPEYFSTPDYTVSALTELAGLLP